MSKWLLTVLFLVGSAFLTHLIPFTFFFRYVDTSIHETGHAAVTLLLSGHVMDIELYRDTSGVTHSSLTRAWSIVPVALAGYMTASLFAWALFALHARGRQREGLLILTILSGVSLVLFVRNGYGILWLTAFIGLNILVLSMASRGVLKWYYLAIAFLSLEESVFGPFSLFMMAVERPSAAGDATVLATASPVPSLVWAVWFMLFALWCAKRALQCYFIPQKRIPDSHKPYKKAHI